MGNQRGFRASLAVEGCRVHSQTQKEPTAHSQGCIGALFLLCQLGGPLSHPDLHLGGLRGSSARTCV